MKFSEMPYARPDLDAVKQQFADLRTRLESAKIPTPRPAKSSWKRKRSTNTLTLPPSWPACATALTPATNSTTRR